MAPKRLTSREKWTVSFWNFSSNVIAVRAYLGNALLVPADMLSSTSTLLDGSRQLKNKAGEWVAHPVEVCYQYLIRAQSSAPKKTEVMVLKPA